MKHALREEREKKTDRTERRQNDNFDYNFSCLSLVFLVNVMFRKERNEKKTPARVELSTT